MALLSALFNYENKIEYLQREPVYRPGTVNSNTVNLKFHFIQIFYDFFVNSFPMISCLKCTVNSNFHLIGSETLPTCINVCSKSTTLRLGFP